MSDDPLRVLMYIRQSEERPGEDAKTSLSLRSQEDRGRAWCAANNAVVLGVVADHDLRGYDPARPGIRQLLDDAERLGANAVWVLSLSRFARDHILQELIWRDLQARGVKHLISEIESGTDDPFIRGIYGLLHSKNRVEMSAHLRGAFARRAKDGGFPPGPTPTGFKRPHRITVHRANGTHYERETGQPAIDPDGANLIREIADRFDGGESLHAIADDLARRGPGPRGGTWTRSTVKRMLQSPIYAGDIVHHGVVVAHNDEWQIVPREQWDRIQARMTRQPVIRRQAIDSWLEGLVMHACGHRMYYQAYTGHSAGHGGMFVCRWESELPSTRCRLGRRIIGAQLLERVTRECLARDLGLRRTAADAFRLAQEIAGGTQAAHARKRFDRALADATARWRRNHERFSEGKLPPELMDAEDARFAHAQADHAAAIAGLPALPDGTAISALVARLADVSALLPRMTAGEFRETLDALGTVRVSDAGVSIDYHVDKHGYVITPTVIPVPKGGKGFRTDPLVAD